MLLTTLVYTNTRQSAEQGDDAESAFLGDAPPPWRSTPPPRRPTASAWPRRAAAALAPQGITQPGRPHKDQPVEPTEQEHKPKPNEQSNEPKRMNKQ